MIVNHEKFQAIVVKRNHEMLDSYPLHIMNENINFKASVKLPRNDTDSKLTNDNDISTLCMNASNQLNAISRSQMCMDFKENEILIALKF